MQPQVLVISDPPHSDVDYEAAAELLGLSIDDARLKIDFCAPEVLRATDWDLARVFSESLRAVGLSVAVVSGRELERVPWPVPVRSLTFADGALVAGLEEGEIEVPYDTPVLGVYCKPPPDFPKKGAEAPISGGDGRAFAEATEWMERLDLYHVRGGALWRLAVVQGFTDVADTGRQRGATGAEDLAATVGELEGRFAQCELDTRLENVRPRQRFVGGDRGFDIDLRKLYSFGTLLLRQALESISPELRNVTQYELGSRLAYVLSRHGGEQRG